MGIIHFSDVQLVLQMYEDHSTLEVRDNLSRRAQLESGRKDLIPVGDVQVLLAHGNC